MVDFEFSSDQEAWRSEIRGWIREEFGDDWNGLDVANDEEGSNEAWEFAKGVAHQAGREGLGPQPAWPGEHGGMGLSFAEQAIFNEELAYHRVPGPDLISVGYVGPTLLVYGTDQQKESYLDDIVNSRVSWCQGYSEPGSGSDLASLQTRAVPRRRRLRDQRSEDLDLQRPPRRLDVRARPAPIRTRPSIAGLPTCWSI